jgi:hypothetical protein
MVGYPVLLVRVEMVEPSKGKLRNEAQSIEKIEGEWVRWFLRQAGGWVIRLWRCERLQSKANFAPVVYAFSCIVSTVTSLSHPGYQIRLEAKLCEATATL